MEGFQFILKDFAVCGGGKREGGEWGRSLATRMALRLHTHVYMQQQPAAADEAGAAAVCSGRKGGLLALMIFGEGGFSASSTFDQPGR